MRFEGRDLKDYAEPVLLDQLQEGKVYFAVVFLDKDGLVPTIEPRVFVGPKLKQKELSFIFRTSRPTGAGFASSHLMLRKKQLLKRARDVTSSNMIVLSMFCWRAL